MGATERILQFIEYKGITKYKFCKDLGFSNKFLDNSSNMGTDKACKILHHFPEINSEWLITGKGEMLKTPARQADPTQQVAETQATYNNTAHLEEKIAFLQRENRHLQEWLKDKDKVIKALEEKESRRIQELEAEIARLTQENHAIKSQPQNRKTG